MLLAAAGVLGLGLGVGVGEGRSRAGRLGLAVNSEPPCNCCMRKCNDNLVEENNGGPCKHTHGHADGNKKKSCTQ